MEKSLRWASMLTTLVGFSFFAVAIKYWLWEQTLHAHPVTSFCIEMPPLGLAYTGGLNAFYSPGRAVVDLIADRLPYGGIAIDAVSDFIAVLLQNALILLGCYGLLRRRRTK